MYSQQYKKQIKKNKQTISLSDTTNNNTNYINHIINTV